MGNMQLGHANKRPVSLVGLVPFSYIRFNPSLYEATHVIGL